MESLSTLRMSMLSLERDADRREREGERTKLSHSRFPLIDSRSVRCSKPFVPILMNDFNLENRQRFYRDELRIRIEHGLINVRSVSEHLRNRTNRPYTHTERDWRKCAKLSSANLNAPMGDQR